MVAVTDTGGGVSQKKLGLSTGLPFCFVNMDIHFENDRWLKWPPAPAMVVFIVKYLAYWLHSDWWKFASVDKKGNLVHLYAVPKSEAKSAWKILGCLFRIAVVFE